MIKEFKAFIMKGNVLELAVAVIMATYFGAVVKSMVDDIIMPPIGHAISGVDFNDLKFVIQEEISATGEGDAIIEGKPEVAIYWGRFVNQIITLVIVAFVIFLIVKSYNKTEKPEEKPAPDPGPSEKDLLTEIRDALKK